jgi:hypothetical protein
MSRIRVGDTVAFRRDLARKCASPGVSDFRATVTAIADGWVFMTGRCGTSKVMPATNLSKVAHNGVILELV